jgi:hypothetical protein
MSSIFTSVRTAITTTLDTATDIVKAAQETVSMATTYVHHRAVSQQIVDKDTVVLSTTLALELIQVELEGNEKRQELFDKTAALFD